MLRKFSIKLRLAVIVAIGAIGLVVLSINLLMKTKDVLFEGRVREIALASEVAAEVLAQ